jgi:hypothetical protein
MKFFNKLLSFLFIALLVSCSSNDDNQLNEFNLESDRNALIEIYNANDDNTLTWDITTTDVSSWNGITVEDNRVTVVKLGDTNLEVLPADALLKLTALKHLIANSNSISSINVSSNVNLDHLTLYDNQLVSIDVSKNILLEQLLLENNELKNLDVSMLTKLTDLKATQNNFTNSVNIANGNNSNMTRMLISSDKLNCVQVDNGATNGFTGWSISSWASYSTNCQ